MNFKEFISYLDINKIEYKEWKKNFVLIYACSLFEVVHSYGDWEGNPDTDYNGKSEFIRQRVYNTIMKNQKYFGIIDCDGCCGCGDW